MCSTFDPSLPTMIHTLSLHDALPIYHRQFLHGFKAAIKILPHNFTQPLNSSLKMRLGDLDLARCKFGLAKPQKNQRSEEHTSELQSRGHLVCRLLLEKKKTIQINKLI